MDTSSWNRIGRDKNERVCAAFDDIIERDGETDEDLESDERSEELADAVLEQVVALNSAGTWRDARTQFDTAFLPFVPHMEATEQELAQVVMLGPDSFLLRKGDDTEDGPVMHVDGDSVEPVAGAVGFGVSRNRKWLAVATEEGMVISEGFKGARKQTVPWPSEVIRPTSVGVSDDGASAVIANDAAGVWLARNGAFEQLMPREGIGDDDEPDFVHAAISPDGRFVAYGWQDAPGHYVDNVSGERPTQHGVVDTVMDTPYHVLFTDDSTRLLSNTRYGESGVTVCVGLDGLRGVEEYDDLPDDTPRTDEYLRAYGIALLPGEHVGADESVAWIGGAGWSHAVRLSGGAPVFTQLLGSRLHAFDYHPGSGRVAVASASGVLHVLDPKAQAEPGRERGYKPRRELYRWLFWDTLDAPVRW